MAMVVQHNIQAMNANRLLGVTTGQQSKSTEKLSSGYRINRAADDAAGLTISEKMRKQIRGLDQASANAEDGVSAVQTAEGAMTEVHSMLQRMNELATQAANGTNSKSDREAIQKEINALNTEIDRVAETTKFNEIYLLKGDEGTKTIDLKAHTAGLEGTLEENADGTYTFTMDELKGGETVNIGGRTYKIAGGGEEDDAEAPAPAGLEKIRAAVDTALTGTTGSIKVGDKTYTYDGTTDNQWEDGDGNAAGTIEVKAGDEVEISDGTNTTVYKMGAAAADAQTAVDAAFGAASPANGDTIKVGSTTYTYDGATDHKWEDGSGNAVDKIDVKAGDEVSITDTANNKITTFYTEKEEEAEEKDPKAPENEITVEEAYKKAREELEKANQIGDTKKSAKVVFGSADAEGDGEGGEEEALKVGDKVKIGDDDYYVGGADATEAWTAIEAKITEAAGGVTTTVGANLPLGKVGSISDGANTVYIYKTVDGSLAYHSSATAPAYNNTGSALATNPDMSETDAKNLLNTAGTAVTFTPASGDAFTTGVADDTTDGAKVVSADKIKELQEAAAAAGGEVDAGTPSNVFEITVGSTDVAKILSFNLHVGADSDMTNKISVDIETMNTNFLGIKDLDVVGATKENGGDDGGIAATYAIDAIADAIAKVSAQRSELGAVQNRLEHTISNLDNIVENTTSAESRIRDTDMAEEMVEYSKNNILAQAGQSMLAQANQSSQGVLSLLQ